MRRSVEIPGRAIDLSVIMADTAGNAIMAIPHGDSVIVVFAQRPRPVAREMTLAEATEFKDGLIAAYQSMEYESVISQMEKDFES